MPVNVQDTVDKILAGDVRTAAKLIRDIDDGRASSREILKALYPHTGRAYIIGVSGFPGVGKSTLVDQMIEAYRGVGKSLGVLAVDPTSPFSGGAILGDRVRMQRHGTDPEVFIRSLATRGHFGGLNRSTRNVIDVLDAMGNPAEVGNSYAPERPLLAPHQTRPFLINLVVLFAVHFLLVIGASVAGQTLLVGAGLLASVRISRIPGLLERSDCVMRSRP